MATLGGTRGDRGLGKRETLHREPPDRVCGIDAGTEVHARGEGERVLALESREGTISLSCIGEGNGNPLQCSCLENPRDEGAWRAAVYGVAQSRTQSTS